jgi:hypothetical protein
LAWVDVGVVEVEGEGDVGVDEGEHDVCDAWGAAGVEEEGAWGGVGESEGGAWGCGGLWCGVHDV